MLIEIVQKSAKNIIPISFLIFIDAYLFNWMRFWYILYTSLVQMT